MNQEKKRGQNDASNLENQSSASKLPPFFSWEILFSICCLLILFTHWALSRNQGVSDQEEAWVLLVQLQSQLQSPADHRSECLHPNGAEPAGPLLTQVLGSMPECGSHRSYGFGLFPQFSVGSVWPVSMFFHCGNMLWGLVQTRVRTPSYPTGTQVVKGSHGPGMF